MKARAFFVIALVAVMSAGVYADKKDKLKDIKCPVSGKAAKDIDGSSVDFKVDDETIGKVYFCCAGCPTAYKKDPEKFANKAKHQLLATSQVKQVKCPLTGKDNPKVKVKVAGAQVLLCCNGCKGKVNKAEGDDQLALVFDGKCSFDKAFAVAKKDKE